MVIINDDIQILDANPEASSIYGLDHQSLLGQPFQRYLPDEFDFEAAWYEFKHADRERGTLTIIIEGTDQFLAISRELTDRDHRRDS